VAKNSEVHAARIKKVRDGFEAGRVPTLQRTRLIEMFDALDPNLARTVAERTEFSVSTASKLFASNGEARRQMARAALFVQDLQALFSSDVLPTRASDATFASMWQGAEDKLRTQLQGLAKALTDFDTNFRAVLDAKIPERPKPVVGKLRISNELSQLLSNVENSKRGVMPTRPQRVVGKLTITSQMEGLLTSRVNRMEEVRGGLTPIAAAKTAWSDAKTRLVSDFSLQLGKSLSNIESIQIAATGAYNEFEEFFKASGKETEAKLSLAKSFFKAVADYAPFPISVVGKIGGAAVGLLHVDTQIQQTRSIGQSEYFNSDIPTLVAATAKLDAVKNWGTDLTRLGVNGSAISSSTTIKDTIDSAKVATLTALIGVFTEAINETYGDNPSQMADKSTQFFSAVNTSNPNARPELLSQLTVHKITLLSDATRQAIVGMQSLPLIESKALQRYIELQLFAEYMAQLAPGSDFDVTIPDALINRLATSPFNLVTKKSGSGQSAQIYQSGKIPWQGHIRHKGAIILFFRWYAKNVNAFDIAVGRISISDVDAAITTTVKQIGTAIAAHTITRTLRSDDADWAKVTQAVLR